MNWDSETKPNSIIKKTGKHHLYSYLQIKLLKILTVACWVSFGKGSNYSLICVWRLILKINMQFWEPEGIHAVFVGISFLCKTEHNYFSISLEREYLLISRSLNTRECLVSVSSLLLNHWLILLFLLQIEESKAYLVVVFLDSQSALESALKSIKKRAMQVDASQVPNTLAFQTHVKCAISRLSTKDENSLPICSDQK